MQWVHKEVRCNLIKLLASLLLNKQVLAQVNCILCNMMSCVSSDVFCLLICFFKLHCLHLCSCIIEALSQEIIKVVVVVGRLYIQGLFMENMVIVLRYLFFKKAVHMVVALKNCMLKQ